MKLQVSCTCTVTDSVRTLLDVLSPGSNLQQFSTYISKLFPHAASLLFDSATFPLSPSRSPYPTHIPSGEGARRVTGIVSLLGEKTALMQVSLTASTC